MLRTSSSSPSNGLPMQEVQIAVILMHLVPSESFTDQIALYCAGMSWDYIVSSYQYPSSQLKKRMSNQKKLIEQNFGSKHLHLAYDEQSIKERYTYFVQFAFRWSRELHSFNPKSCGVERSAAILLVGGTKEMTSGKITTALYRMDQTLFFRDSTNNRITRGRDHAVKMLDPVQDFPKLKSSNLCPPMNGTSGMSLHNHNHHHHHHHAPPELARTSHLNYMPSQLKHPPLSNIHITPASPISIVTVTSGSSTSPSSISSKHESRERNSISSFSSSSASKTNVTSTATSDNTNVSKSTQSNRATSMQAHQKRKQSSTEKKHQIAAFKTATFVVSLFKEMQLPCFNSSVDAVQKVNAMYGGNYVTSHEINTAVKKGRIGQSPPRQGPLGKLSVSAFELLCALFFTCSAIAQHNCEEALTRPILIEVLDQIVRPYFSERGSTIIARHLHERIESENAYRQNIDSADPRQKLRVEWFRMSNLIKHYDNTEKFLVNNGFARHATNEEKEIDGENIKWKLDQMKRGANFDEMSFGLSADANSLGGREGMIYVTDLVKNSGQSTQHSSLKVTVFAGMNFADEAFPPLIILPTSGETTRLKTELISRMHQIEGRFGHSNRKRFSPMIAATPKGSMNATILDSYLKYLTQLYPDIRDEEGKRLFVKLDNGVGRDNTDFLFNSRSFGAYIWPGLPNTSEGTQEMDQAFGLFKSRMELNRRNIFQAKQSGVSILDLPFMLFGGQYEVGDGKSPINLPNAFEESFDSKHLEAARVACGYCPANRNALNHRKCRRDIGEGTTNQRTATAILPRSNIAL